MNHSCDPNCALQKWVVGSGIRVGMFAIKDIQANEELTFDYKFERYGMEAQPCYCGTSACKGYIGGKSESVSADDEDDEDEDLEEEDNKPARERIIKPITGLENTEQVQKLVKFLMYSSSSAPKVLKKLSVILKTESTPLLKRFIICHGLNVLKTCLDAHMDGKTVVGYQILLVLKLLPVSSKNSILGLEPLVEKMKDDKYGVGTSQLASELLESWKDLQLVYKIPKRALPTVTDKADEKAGKRSLEDTSSWLSETKKRSSINSYNRDDRESPYERDRYSDRDRYDKDRPVDRDRFFDHRSKDKYYNKDGFKSDKKDKIPPPTHKLKPNWMQSQSDNGTIYYTNLITNETTLIPPIADELPAKPQPNPSKPLFCGVSQDDLEQVLEQAEKAVKEQKEKEEEETKKLEQEKLLEKKKLEKLIRDAKKKKDSASSALKTQEFSI